jgi:hypothetical protein
MVAAGQSSGATVVRASTIGIFPGDYNIWNKFSEVNAWPMTLLLYQDINYLSYAYLKSFLDQGLQVQLVLEAWDSYPNLWALSGGSKDWQLQQFFQQVKQDGRHVTIRILHEFNGNW